MTISKLGLVCSIIIMLTCLTFVVNCEWTWVPDATVIDNNDFYDYRTEKSWNDSRNSNGATDTEDFLRDTDLCYNPNDETFSRANCPPVPDCSWSGDNGPAKLCINRAPFPDDHSYYYVLMMKCTPRFINCDKCYCGFVSSDKDKQSHCNYVYQNPSDDQVDISCGEGLSNVKMTTREGKELSFSPPPTSHITTGTPPPVPLIATPSPTLYTAKPTTKAPIQTIESTTVAPTYASIYSATPTSKPTTKAPVQTIESITVAPTSVSIYTTKQSSKPTTKAPVQTIESTTVAPTYFTKPTSSSAITSKPTAKTATSLNKPSLNSAKEMSPRMPFQEQQPSTIPVLSPIIVLPPVLVKPAVNIDALPQLTSTADKLFETLSSLMDSKPNGMYTFTGKSGFSASVSIQANAGNNQGA